MERTSIKVEARKILGKKVKKLRAGGQLPANIFGKGMKSIAVSVDLKDFQKAFSAAGEATLLDVKLGSVVYPSLIHNLQREPKRDFVIHVDFHKVNLKEKITTTVSVILEGESSVVKSGEGLLLQTINEIELECLPTDIPSHIVIDAKKLTEVGQSILVKDLKIDRDKVAITNEPEEVVVTVQTAEMKEEEPEAVVSPVEVEATAEKGEAEGEEAAPAAEDKKEEPNEG